MIAVTEYGFIQNPGEVNPYFANAYHIVDAVTAHRTNSTPPTCGPQGPVNSAGTICQQTSGDILAVAWDGTGRDLGNVSEVPPVVLNPDGRSAAVAIGTLGSGPTTIYPISLLSGGTANRTVATGTPAGWFDASNLLFVTGPCCEQSTSAAVLDAKSNTVTPVGSGMAGNADPYAPFFVPIPNSLN